jgi:ribosomal protein L12E/L44/L45/RPP1/RPP2
MKGNFKPLSMKNIMKLFVAAAIVAFAASCSSKPAEQEATAPQEEPVAPAETTPEVEEVPADTTVVVE